MGSFDERYYLDLYPDVAAAVRDGSFASGAEHFRLFGEKEGRQTRHDLGEARRRKMERLRPFLRLDLPHVRRGDKYDFLTEELRRETAIVDTDAVSSNNYDPIGLALIDGYRDGLVLDCGAGRRGTYYDNVVNFEIVDYDTTDVVGVGEALPFRDDAFDGVISVAVLEHVRDPFRCASEIGRVLRPGGRLICCVPFLQPLHGFPHHYYNMSHQGLRALFERSLKIDDHLVIDSILPIWSLTWFLQAWNGGLTGEAQKQFHNLKIADLLDEPQKFLDTPWVRGLSKEKNFELASATLLLAHKPRTG
jgi:SAM-dependent methyltransferase